MVIIEREGTSKDISDLAVKLTASQIRQGHYEEGEALLTRSILSQKSVKRSNRQDMVSDLILLADVYMSTKKFSEAEETAQKAIEMLANARHPGDDKMGFALSVLGRAQHAQKQYEHADGSFQKSESYLERAFGVDHANLIPVLTNRALTLWEMGKKEESVKLGVRIAMMMADTANKFNAG